MNATVNECEHGEIGGVLSGCPPCLGSRAADPEPVVIYQRTQALFSGRCPLDCGHSIEIGEPVALAGEDRRSAVWMHQGCAEGAADGEVGGRT